MSSRCAPVNDTVQLKGPTGAGVEEFVAAKFPLKRESSTDEVIWQYMSLALISSWNSLRVMYFLLAPTI